MEKTTVAVLETAEPQTSHKASTPPPQEVVEAFRHQSSARETAPSHLLRSLISPIMIRSRTLICILFMPRNFGLLVSSWSRNVSPSPPSSTPATTTTTAPRPASARILRPRASSPRSRSQLGLCPRKV